MTGIKYKHGEPISVIPRAKPGRKPRKIPIKCPECGRREDTMYWHELAGRRLCRRCWDDYTDLTPHTPPGWVPANRRSDHVDPLASRHSQPFRGDPPLALS